MIVYTLFNQKYQSNDCKRMKKQIENKITNQRSTEEYSTNPLSLTTPTREKFLNDTFGKNPVLSMSKEQTITFNNQQKEKNKIKCNRVEKYLSSEGFKSSLGNNQETFNYDKITNIGKTQVMNMHKSEEPKKYLRSFKHLYESKRVYYQ